MAVKHSVGAIANVDVSQKKKTLFIFTKAFFTADFLLWYFYPFAVPPGKTT